MDFLPELIKPVIYQSGNHSFIHKKNSQKHTEHL